MPSARLSDRIFEEGAAVQQRRLRVLGKINRLKSETSYIYFIQAEGGGPIKIGRSRYPRKRLYAFQTGCVDRLVLRHTVAVHERKVKQVEAKIQARFADQRLHGEWFEPNDELRKLAHAV